MRRKLSPAEVNPETIRELLALVSGLVASAKDENYRFPEHFDAETKENVSIFFRSLARKVVKIGTAWERRLNVELERFERDRIGSARAVSELHDHVRMVVGITVQVGDTIKLVMDSGEISPREEKELMWAFSLINSFERMSSGRDAS